MAIRRKREELELRDQAIRLTKRGRDILNNSIKKKIGKGTYILIEKPKE